MQGSINACVTGGDEDQHLQCLAVCLAGKGEGEETDGGKEK